MIRETISSQSHYTNPRQSQYIMSQQSCSSAFNCGYEYNVMETKLTLLSERVSELEADREKQIDFFNKASKLIQIQRYILIILPIIELIIVGVVAYFFSSINSILYVVVGLIGITTIINGFFVPKQIKDLEKRVESVEKQARE